MHQEKKRKTFAQRHLTCKARLHNLSMTQKLYVYVNVQKSHRCDEQMYDALEHAGVVRCVHIIMHIIVKLRWYNGKDRERDEKRGEKGTMP